MMMAIGPRRSSCTWFWPRSSRVWFTVHHPADPTASIPFALLSLWGTGRSLNLFSALGVLLLLGIVKRTEFCRLTI
jgi:hypothetical protein